MHINCVDLHFLGDELIQVEGKKCPAVAESSRRALHSLGDELVPRNGPALNSLKMFLEMVQSWRTSL